MASKKSLFVLNVVSSVLISVGSVTAVTNLENPLPGIIVAFLGAIGFGIREAIKTK